MLKVVEYKAASPAEQLAMEEVLLNECDNGELGPVLLWWESSSYFVVVGYSNRVGREVFVERCQEDGVPILRRCSGGGTVLLGPGALCYSLVLPISHDPALETINGTNRFIMERNREAFADLVKEPVLVQGYTDLTLGRVKFSGNAQRRKRNAVLFHGSILHGMELSLLERYLRVPSSQPEYRENRAHESFVCNFPSTVNMIKDSFEAKWNAVGEIDQSGKKWEMVKQRVERLVAERYSTEAWNEKF
ncbi:MAG: lipoate--protein ligase family protein [Verrucomicrobiota bacterium]|nr:lipoate--protein ligase family protein [Verrucomicrobiota bacterium]